MSKKRIAIVLTSFFFIAAGCRESEKKETGLSGKEQEISSNSPPAAGKETGINWVNDYALGLEKARATGKPVLIDFYADWCHWCHVMADKTFTDPEIIRLSNEFVCLKIDTNKDRETPAEYSIRGLPTIVYLSSSGKKLLTKVGYRDPTNMLSDMKEAIELEQKQ